MAATALPPSGDLPGSDGTGSSSGGPAAGGPKTCDARGMVEISRGSNGTGMM